MKAAEIKVGGHYTARVSGRLVTVRVDNSYVEYHPPIMGYRTVYYVTNLATGRKTTFRSAQRFRCEVK